MSDYAKKTVAELQEILKSRGLASSGKKAELVARLNENDKEAEVTEEPAPAAIATAPSPATGAAAEPTSDPAPPAPAPTSNETTAAAAAATEPDQASPDTTLANQTNYALNLPTSSLDNELAKRKARAERFGTSAAAPVVSSDGGDATAAADAAATTTTTETSAEDTAALKNLERAKRFGTGDTAIGKLDEALSSELGRGSRKRGHAAVADAGELDDPGLKRGFANRGRGGRGGRFNGARGRGGGKPGASAGAAKPQGVQKPSTGPAFTSDKDRLAAEARKKKFATA